MAISILRFLGERVAHKTLARNSHTGGFLDVKLGFAMLKDRRVPLRSKLLALGVGAGLIALLIGLEVPLEGVLAVVLPVIGPAADLLTNSLEAVIGTVGFASMLLPHVAPKRLAQQIHNERDGIVEEPILSAPPMDELVRPSYDRSQSARRLIYPQR